MALVKVIGIDWAPSAVPLAGVVGDSMKAKGWLLSGQKVVRELPEVEAYIEAGPAAQLPKAVGVWPVYPPVNATTLRIKLFGNKLSHTLDIDGVRVSLGAGKPDTWAQYDVVLRR